MLADILWSFIIEYRTSGT